VFVFCNDLQLNYTSNIFAMLREVSSLVTYRGITLVSRATITVGYGEWDWDEHYTLMAENDLTCQFDSSEELMCDTSEAHMNILWKMLAKYVVASDVDGEVDQNDMFARVGHKYGNAAVYDPSVLSSSPHSKLVLGKINRWSRSFFTLWKYWPEERKNQNGMRYSVVERMVTDVTPLSPAMVVEREIILNYYRRCNICHEPDANFCSACFSVSYCCRDHQKSDYHEHKKVCRVYRLLRITRGERDEWYTGCDAPSSERLEKEIHRLQEKICNDYNQS
jgi:hypothetical protein